jgi:acetylornithine deacetylase
VKTRLTYDQGGRKANLFATIGEERGGGLVLSGHTDVVPVDGQNWSTDPFRAEVKDGRIYGRGACDMKGFIACALAAVPGLLRGSGHRPIHLALSYDEEVDCSGARNLLSDLAAQGLQPAACVVGEPTEMGVVVAHKGRREMRCCVRGREAHASLPMLGVNAIEYGARVISQIRWLADREARQGPRDEGFEVPHATVNCGTIRGGIAPNVVPRDCEFTVDQRYLPGATGRLFEEVRRYIERDVVPEMRARCADASVDWSIANETPPLDMSEEDPLVIRVRDLAGAGRLGRVAYTTEAGLFQQAGIPTVICGPGSIEQAHRPDEYVDLSQLSACERLLHKLAAEFQRLT